MRVIIITSRVWYVRSRPVRRRVNRTRIGNSRRRHVRSALVRITIVWPVHPWVITVYPHNIVLLLLWFGVTCCLCQFRRVITVDGSPNIPVAMSDTRVRVGTFIGNSVHYSSRAWPVVAIIGRAHNTWSIHIDRIVTDHRPTVVTVVDIVNTYRFARIPANLIRSRAAHISNAVIHVSVVDNGSLVDDVDHTRAGYIIPGDIRAADIGLRCADPVIVGYVISATK